MIRKVVNFTRFLEACRKPDHPRPAPPPPPPAAPVMTEAKLEAIECRERWKATAIAVAASSNVTKPERCGAWAESIPAMLRGRALDEEPRVRHHCNMGVGCEEAGICYAAAHGRIEDCGRSEARKADGKGGEA